MTTTECTHDKTRIGEPQSFCPDCARVDDPKKFPIAVYIGCGVLFVALCTGGAELYLRGDRGRPESNPVLVREQAPLEEKLKAEQRALGETTIPIDAVALWSAYAASEAKADLVYRGKRMLVSGAVKSVKKEENYDVVVKLSGGDFLKSTRAALIESEAPRVAALKEGQRVTLLCTGNGRILESPSLVGCTLQ